MVQLAIGNVMVSGTTWSYKIYSANWWRKLWERTKIVNITACYDIPDLKSIWYPWTYWENENRGFDDIDFFNADTENNIAIILLAVEKTTEEVEFD